MSYVKDRVFGDQLLCTKCDTLKPKSDFLIDRRCKEYLRIRHDCSECRRQYRKSVANRRKDQHSTWRTLNKGRYDKSYYRKYKMRYKKQRWIKSILKHLDGLSKDQSKPGYIYLLARSGSNKIIFGITKDLDKRMSMYASYGDYEPVLAVISNHYKAIEKIISIYLRLNHYVENFHINIEKLYVDSNSFNTVANLLINYSEEIIVNKVKIEPVDAVEAIREGVLCHLQ